LLEAGETSSRLARVNLLTVMPDALSWITWEAWMASFNVIDG
jgi:hypothetical protein